MCSSLTYGLAAHVSARMPPHHPVPMIPMLTFRMYPPLEHPAIQGIDSMVLVRGAFRRPRPIYMLADFAFRARDITKIRRKPAIFRPVWWQGRSARATKGFSDHFLPAKWRRR